MGCTHHTLYFIYLPIKLASFENLINFTLKHSNLALHGIYALCKIKYPIVFLEACVMEPVFWLMRFGCTKTQCQKTGLCGSSDAG